MADNAFAIGRPHGAGQQVLNDRNRSRDKRFQIHPHARVNA
jgi:hypothetical protein